MLGLTSHLVVVQKSEPSGDARRYEFPAQEDVGHRIEVRRDREILVDGFNAVGPRFVWRRKSHRFAVKDDFTRFQGQARR